MFRGSLTGPASSGKTTILNGLKAVLPTFAQAKGLEVVFQEERVRSIFEQEFQEEYGTFENLMAQRPLEFQLRASEVLMADAFAHQSRDIIVIADRAALDMLVYTTINIARGFRDPWIETMIFGNLKKAMLRVDKVFMTRPLPLVVNDGFRPDCYAGDIRILEENLFNVLGGTHPNTVWLPTEHDARLDLIMNTIRGAYE